MEKISPEIKFDVRGAQTTQRQLAEFIRAELAKIGINIKVVLNTFLAFFKNQDKESSNFGWMVGRNGLSGCKNSLRLLHSNNHPQGY